MNACTLVMLTGLILGLIIGAVMHRSDFCIAGMFRDLFLVRKTVMLKSLVLLVVATTILFELARQAGLLAIYPFPLLYPPTLANLIGGLLFGVGMVLAGGCVVGTLYKMGAGRVLSAVAFIGLIAGSGLYAEIHPFWAAFIKFTTFFPGKITIPQIIGIDPLVPISAVVLAGSVVVFRWNKQGNFIRPSHVEGYLQPWKAAIILAVVSTVSYILVGMPLGITSSYTKFAAYAGNTIFPGHMSELVYFNLVPLKYTHPLTGEYLQGGGGPTFDILAAIQFPLVAGIIVGSGLSAFSLREFRPRFRLPLRQYVSALSGGIIMGLASRMAPTCNIWHFMGGLPILTASSFLFLAGILPGAWLGGKIMARAVISSSYCRIETKEGQQG